MNEELAIKSVRNHFSSLLEVGELTLAGNDPSLSGASGWVIQLSSSVFSVRLSLDRGQVFTDLGKGASPDRWHDFTLVLEFLGGLAAGYEYQISGGPTSTEDLDKQIEVAGGAVLNHFPLLVRFFTADDFDRREADLLAFGKARSDKRWMRLLR